MALHLITNYHLRETLDGWNAPADVRAEFPYIDWAGVDAGTDSAEFVRYRGDWYDLGDVQRAPDSLRALGFDGMVTQTMWSGIAFRYFDAEGNPYEGEVVCAYFYISD